MCPCACNSYILWKILPGNGIPFRHWHGLDIIKPNSLLAKDLIAYSTGTTRAASASLALARRINIGSVPACGDWAGAKMLLNHYIRQVPTSVLQAVAQDTQPVREQAFRPTPYPRTCGGSALTTLGHLLMTPSHIFHPRAWHSHT